ncbi:hypothetical protein PP707_02830 [Acetobacter pasteurianus]|nr:hypothetical protein [Acetobacter pasteurianus]
MLVIQAKYKPTTIVSLSFFCFFIIIIIINIIININNSSSKKGSEDLVCLFRR